jgi:predicted DNA-binding transcriptional regulator AlpA
MPVEKQQFQLPLVVTKCLPRRQPAPDPERRERTLPERVGGIDQVLGTHDVERITGRHRCTIYRWVRSGTFPEKRAGGGRGWLRSDIERWLLQGGGSADGDTPSAKPLKLTAPRSARSP